MEAVANVLVYASTLLAIGTCTVGWWTRGSIRQQLSDSDAHRLQRSLALLMVRVAVLLTIGLLVRLVAHTLATFGSTSWDSLEIIALQSRWGQAWRMQVLAAVGFLAVAIAIRTERLSGWLAAPLAVLAVCATQPLLGHAAGSVGRHALHTSHILGAGVWLGTLAVVVIAAGSVRVQRTLLERFSPIAVTGLSVLALSGLIAAYAYLGSLRNLVGSGYGRTLSGKIFLFLIAAWLGWMNWRRFSTGPERSGPPVSPLSFARLEVALALLVVVLTSVLVQLEHP